MILLPVGHEKSTVRRLPWVSFGIMAAWLAAWALAPVLGDLAAAGPEPLGWLLALVGHGSGWALLGNMLILYLAGPFLEDVWGRGLFAGLYAVSGLAAAGAWALLHSGGLPPAAGASGAVAGVMGAFLVRWGRTEVDCVVLVGALCSREFTAPAWTLLTLWLAEQLALALWQGTGGPAGGAAWSQLGGFAAGAALAAALRGWRVEERWIGPALRRRLERPLLDAAGLDAMLAARAAGRRRQALALLEREAARRPADPDVVLALWSVAGSEGRPELASPAMLELISRELRSGRDDEAAVYWLRLVREVPDPGAEPALLLRLARALERIGYAAEAARALRLGLHDRQGRLTPAVALGMARAARDLGDPELARGAAEWVLARDGTTGAARLGAEALLAAPATSPAIR